MEIRQLIYFKTIVEQGTISKAAQVLHMAQPPLSMQLKQLEDELETQLIERGHRQITLTTQGKLFYHRTLQILELVHQSQLELKTDQQIILRIGITSSNGGMMFHQIFEDFLTQYPHLTFEIYEGNTYQMIDLIHSHMIDIAFIRTPFDNSNVDYCILKKEPMVAIGHLDFFSSLNNLTISQLKNVPLIIYRRYETLITNHCLKHHFNPRIICRNDDCRSSIMWASQKKGIALVPYSALDLYPTNDLVTLPLEDEELMTSIALVWSQDKKPTSIINQIINAFKTQ